MKRVMSRIPNAARRERQLIMIRRKRGNRKIECSERAVCNERGILKSYLLKESLERLWMYRYEGAMLNYLGLDLTGL